MEENEIQYGKITAAGETGRRGREQEMKENGVIQEYTGSLSRQIREEYHISEEYYHGEIKRGLRNSDGTGVMVGVTKVGSVQGYLLQDGQRIPIPGRLYYRGIELNDIVEAHRAEGTFGFEEVAYLLLMGYLPSQGELRHFNEIMNRARKLPEGFTEGMIMRRTSGNIMNELGRSILSLYSYDRIRTICRWTICCASRWSSSGIFPPSWPMPTPSSATISAASPCTSTTRRRDSARRRTSCG